MQAIKVCTPLLGTVFMHMDNTMTVKPFVMQHWPPCNDALLRNFKWDTSLSASQQEPDATSSFSPSLQHHAQLLSPELQFGLQPVETQVVVQSLSSGSHPSSQGHSSFAGTPTAGGHLY